MAHIGTGTIDTPHRNAVGGPRRIRPAQNPDLLATYSLVDQGRRGESPLAIPSPGRLHKRVPYSRATAGSRTLRNHLAGHTMR